MTLRVLSLLVITTNLLLGVFAQVTTNATCLPSFSPLSNSKGQSPCLVAAYLQSECNNGNWDVRDLPANTHYTGPNQAEINPCQCSTVTYSMISACGICQGRTAESWSSWSSNCTTVYPNIFTENIPVNTAVPGWAYLDVTALDGLNITAVETDINAPESTGTAPATGSPTSTQSGIASSSSSSASKRSSHGGAIAGGVVGGLAGLGLIVGGIIIFLIRRRRAHQAPSAAYKGYGIDTPIHSPPPMSQHPTYGPTPSKFYDPADPSTFPSTPAPATIYTTGGGSVLHGQSDDSGQPAKPGQYNFIPEL